MCRNRFKQHWKTIAKNIWYPFSARTKRLTFPCYSHLSIRKNPGNNSTDNHKMPLKGGKKRADCPRVLRVRRGSTVSSLVFFLSSMYLLHQVPQMQGPILPPRPRAGSTLHIHCRTSVVLVPAGHVGQLWT